MQGLGSGAPGRGVKGAAGGCVNWHRRKVAPEQRPTHPYVAPHAAKIHTLITLGVSILPKPLVLKARQRLPRGFDSHRPLHSKTGSDNPGQLARANIHRCLGRSWDFASNSRQTRCPGSSWIAPAFAPNIARIDKYLRLISAFAPQPIDCVGQLTATTGRSVHWIDVLEADIRCDSTACRRSLY
jgi:hypothetical protein